MAGNTRLWTMEGKKGDEKEEKFVLSRYGHDSVYGKTIHAQRHGWE